VNEKITWMGSRKFYKFTIESDKMYE